MFDSIGWGEIFVVILAGLIIIGPERLPGVIMDVRAAIFAARRAINDAKNELYGEEFDELRKPMSTVTEYAAMGPKRAIAKVLFDEDGDYLDQFDPRRMMDGDPSVSNHNRPAEPAAAGAATAGAASVAATPDHAARPSHGAQPDHAAQPAHGTQPAYTGDAEHPQQSHQTSQPQPQPQPQPSQPVQPSALGQQADADASTATVQASSSAPGTDQDPNAIPRPPRRRRRQPGINPAHWQNDSSAQSSGGGFSWADIT